MLRLKLLGAAAVTLVAGCATAPASAQAAVSLTGFSSSANTVTVPASFVLTATLDQDIGPLHNTVSIIDDDTHQDLHDCNAGASCSFSIPTSYWADNSAPHTRHFHAQLTGGGCPCADSPQVAVEIDPFIWDVSLRSSPSAVTIPDAFTVTATLDRDLTPTPYYVEIVDDDTGQSLHECNGGTSCSWTIPTYWYDNANTPLARHFHAEITGCGGPCGRSDQLTVGVNRFIFAVSLETTATRTDSSGHTFYDLHGIHRSGPRKQRISAAAPQQPWRHSSRGLPRGHEL